MIRTKDIRWYLEEPTRLLQMKPFTRGGRMQLHEYEYNPILNNTMLETGFANLELNPISQDTYITEYRPDLHHIILNKSIPHIKVVIDGAELPTNMLELTQTASFQKIIHSAHVRSLTANPLEFNLNNIDQDAGGTKLYEMTKLEWESRDCDWWLSQAIDTCMQLGNCALLFSFDTSKGKYNISSYSYENGYQIIPNYDEYGIEVARSLAYEIDGKTVIETFDDINHYRSRQTSIGWEVTMERHGFSRNPLVIKRGKVAWEYGESSIEMWELMKNIQAIALKRFGTFALVFTGDMDKESFKRDSSTLIINLSSDTSMGKQSADVLKFPESTTIDNYLASLKEDISIFTSTSFITPKDISTTNSGGNGIALAMSNDYALATQNARNWNKYVREMVYLHQEGLDLETNGVEKYGRLRVGAEIVPWSLETNNTKITNLTMESKWLSMKTIIEKSPDAAPDEIERVIKERGSLVPSKTTTEADMQKAENISINKSNEIRDNEKKSKEQNS